MPAGPSPRAHPPRPTSRSGPAPVGGRLRHALHGQHRGARRCVDLLVVVELDDLGGLEVGRRQLGEPHHQHGADREVRSDDGVGRTRPEPLGEPRHVGVGEAGRPDHGVHAVVGARSRFTRAASTTVKSTTTSAPAAATAVGGGGHLDPGDGDAELLRGRCRRGPGRPPRPARTPGRRRPPRTPSHRSAPLHRTPRPGSWDEAVPSALPSSVTAFGLESRDPPRPAWRGGADQDPLDDPGHVGGRHRVVAWATTWPRAGTSPCARGDQGLADPASCAAGRSSRDARLPPAAHVALGGVDDRRAVHAPVGRRPVEHVDGWSTSSSWRGRARGAAPGVDPEGTRSRRRRPGTSTRSQASPTLLAHLLEQPGDMPPPSTWLSTPDAVAVGIVDGERRASRGRGGPARGRPRSPPGARAPASPSWRTRSGLGRAAPRAAPARAGPPPAACSTFPAAATTRLSGAVVRAVVGRRPPTGACLRSSRRRAHDLPAGSDGPGRPPRRTRSTTRSSGSSSPVRTLLEDDLPLRFDLVRAGARWRPHDVGEDVDGQGLAVQDRHVERGPLVRGEGVHVAADRLDRLGDRRPPTGERRP
jgi:hypothetical protein